MLRKITTVLAVILLLVGAWLVGTNVYEMVTQAMQSNAFKDQAAEVLDTKISRDEFQPQEGDIIGLLKIPELGLETAIVEGVRVEDLKGGAGHMMETGYPGDSRQIFLAGHRNTDFGVLKDIRKGMEIIVEMPYGTYKYYASKDYDDTDSTQVIPQTKTEVVNTSAHLDRDELVLMTCFPFTFGAATDYRFLVYAYPAE